MDKKELYHYRKENGLCVYCGKEKDRSDRTMCEKCRTKWNERQRNDMKYFADMRICPICKKNKLFGEEKRCVECRAKFANYQSKYRDLIKKNEYSRAVYVKRKERGICVICGKRNAETNCVKCEVCKRKGNMRNREKYEETKYENEEKRKFRIENGLCTRCGKVLDREGKWCKECSNKVGHGKKKGHIWMQKWT